MGRLDGKVAIVTGAAGGMGREDVRQLAAEGARVVVADVSEEGGSEVAAPYGEAARFAPLDVRDGGQWRQAVAFAEDAFGPVGILVNNAGIVAWGGVEDMDEATFRRILDINTVGTFLGMQAVAGSMKRAGGGCIVNLSSIGGMVGGTSSIGYTASKWAVRGMSKGAALQLAPYGIRVHSVHPGLIDTPMARSSGPRADPPPVGHFGTATDVARLIVFLASDESAYMTGTEQVIDGGVLAGSLHMELALRHAGK